MQKLTLNFKFHYTNKNIHLYYRNNKNIYKYIKHEMN